MLTVNGSVPQQVDIKPALPYGELKETIYMHLPEGYMDRNKVGDLKRYIYRLK
jgi:hypothetical protein